MKRIVTVCKPLIPVIVITAFTGCKAVLGTAVVGTAVAAGTAGLAGYAVYKSGEAVVSTAGSVGSSVASGVGSVGSSTKATVQNKRHTVVVSRGTFKAKTGHAVAALYPAARTVLEEAGFKDVFGKQDSLAGAVRAKTAFDDDVIVTFKLLEKDLTAVEIRIGDGNLQQSEYIYDQILATVAAGNRGGQS